MAESTGGRGYAAKRVVPLSRNRATGEVLRRYHVGVQEEAMPLTEKAATAFMTVAIAGVGPACVALLLLL